MNLLLDTHIALWAIAASPRLPPAAHGLISDPSNTISLSMASLWEIAIKRSVRGARAGGIALSAEEVTGYLDQMGCALLPISASHIVAVEALPRLHGDPFDRLLVAQAMAEPLRLLTHDKRLAAYSDSVILV